MPLLCSYCHKEITEAPIAAIHLGCAPKVMELAATTANTARQQALREIAGDVGCWIRRVNMTGDKVPVSLLEAWHRQLLPLL